MVQRQLTNSKRTRHVWEKIAERIREHGFDRTAGESTFFHALMHKYFSLLCVVTLLQLSN